MTTAGADYDAAMGRGRQQARLLERFGPGEREAWLRGFVEVLGPLPAGGLVAPPDGWAWAESGHHALAGSSGLCHLIRTIDLPQGYDGQGRAGQAFRWDGTPAACGHTATLWTTIGRGDPSRREPCPTCAGTRARG